MGIAQLYTQFTRQMTNLQSLARNAAASNKGLLQRQWYAPTGWTGTPTDLTAMKTPFDRVAMNNAYQSAYTGTDGTVGDVIAIKLQADYLASMERAFRLRYATAVRCGMHAANRRNGHGLSGGGPLSRVTDHVQDVIVSGNAT